MNCPNCDTPMEWIEPSDGRPPFWMCKGCDHQEDER